MPYYRRVNNWAWCKPCSCCRQFDIDQAKKQDTRAKRAARRASRPQNPPPETIQTTTVPTMNYPSLHSIINRQMNYYYGHNSSYGYFTASTYDV
uniref:Uncharacterized protein n=1 Tax=viral metagenome TaxID=1070528 RepID=A0A6C0AIK8_9ZZZZ